jgi:hypothetical protein
VPTEYHKGCSKLCILSDLEELFQYKAKSRGGNSPLLSYINKSFLVDWWFVISVRGATCLERGHGEEFTGTICVCIRKGSHFQVRSTTNHKKLSATGITIRAPSRTLRCLFSLHQRELVNFLRMTVSKMLMFNMKATVFHSTSYRWRFNNSKPGFKKRSPVGWGAKDCCPHVDQRQWLCTYCGCASL